MRFLDGVSVGDCLKDILARGPVMALMSLDEIFESLDESRPVHLLTETKRAKRVALRSVLKSLDMTSQGSIEDTKHKVKEVLARRSVKWNDVFVSLIIVWTDGIEPNAIKQGRNGVWAGSVTFVPARLNWNSRFNTYPLSIGRDKTKDGKGIDHWPVMKRINESIQDLISKPVQCQRYYSAQLGRPVCVVPAQYAYFADQPERRKATGTAPGNQRYHGRFRCSAKQGKMSDVLIPCSDCSATLESGRNPKDCKVCCCWDALCQGPARKLLLMNPEKGYPMQPDSNAERYLENGKVAPKEVTFESLDLALKHAWEMYTSEKWTEHQTRSFLERECLEGGLIDKVVENGMRRSNLDKILQGLADVSEEVVADVREDHNDNPRRYDVPEVPSYWSSGDEISVFVDSPMHLLFLGIVKKVLQVIKEWMIENNIFSVFIERVKRYNQELDDIKSIDYLPIQDFRQGKFGGWVSENYLAFSRIMAWFFQEIGTLLNEDALKDVVVPNTRPYSGQSHSASSSSAREESQNTII